MNSRDKGKRGEREFASLLREHGFDARRGQQFAGGADSPDVVSDALAWLHVEVKRVQNSILPTPACKLRVILVASRGLWRTAGTMRRGSSQCRRKLSSISFAGHFHALAMRRWRKATE